MYWEETPTDRATDRATRRNGTGLLDSIHTQRETAPKHPRNNISSKRRKRSRTSECIGHKKSKEYSLAKKTFKWFGRLFGRRSLDDHFTRSRRSTTFLASGALVLFFFARLFFSTRGNGYAQDLVFSACPDHCAERLVCFSLPSQTAGRFSISVA